ncbi:MAG: PD-(D/E)XK nuclease family protein [Lentisphaeria bacterium]|jgi:hypothetical protein
MAQLVNELSWSASRHKLFSECRRAYFYTYYGAWNGWDAAAPERTRRLYRLKNLRTLDMWAGGIVHETIAEALRRSMMKGTPVTAGELQAHARLKLRSGWVEAVGREWERYPKRTNLFELYYGNGRTLPPEQTERIRRKVNDGLQAFAESATLKELLAVSHLNWKPVDQLDTFALDGLKVWCAVDFAYTDPAGILRILDWKTGAEDAAALRLQLACYTFFAAEKWGVAPERVKVYGVFLREQALVREYPSDPAMLVDARDQILTSAAAMRALVADPVANEPLPEESFPLAESDRPCRWCNYREACPRLAAAPAAPAAPLG